MANNVGILVDLNSKYLMNMVIEGFFFTECVVIVLFAQFDYSVYYSVVITYVKFVFSKKATKIDEIFTVDLTLTIWCQIDGEDFVNFSGLPRKHELYFVTVYM